MILFYQLSFHMNAVNVASTELDGAVAVHDLDGAIVLDDPTRGRGKNGSITKSLPETWPNET